jgi:hypothetical protein
MEVEVYSCGCNIRHQQVDQSEFEGEHPHMVLVSSFVPCDKHKDTKVGPPPDARLMTVMREPEKFLNE